MLGFRFSQYRPEDDQRTPFEKMLEVFLELATYTSGDVDEAIDWLREVDDEYNISGDDYSVDEFIEDLLEKSYITQKGGEGPPLLSPKSEQALRKRALDQVFGKLKKTNKGNHRTTFYGRGDESTEDRRAYKFGDRIEQIDFSESVKNAFLNHGITDDFKMTEDDLEVVENQQLSSVSTVLMIDLSHSMILYGEDRITPAKKVAMALSELITKKYPKDTLDIVAFGNDAWEVSIRDLPYLKVGPFHTNTVAGLERAMDILRRKKAANKQIFMITDGKPSCLKEKNGTYYKNSWGLDPYIVGKCHSLARQCRKTSIQITTFMIASDAYLREFVSDFTEANNGKAFFTGLDNLGEVLFSDFQNNRRKEF